MVSSVAVVAVSLALSKPGVDLGSLHDHTSLPRLSIPLADIICIYACYYIHVMSAMYFHTYILFKQWCIYT